jgi:hypothetical protein
MESLSESGPSVELLWSRSNPVIVGDVLFCIYVNDTSPKGAELGRSHLLLKQFRKASSSRCDFLTILQYICTWRNVGVFRILKG